MQRVKDIVEIALKLAIIAGIAVFLVQYARGAGAGRYQYLVNGEQEYVMDTATGLIYQGGYAMNHLTGKESFPDKSKKGTTSP
jgi:hypothetical protein